MSHIRALLICPDPKLKDAFLESFGKRRDRLIVGKLNTYPDASATAQALKRFGPTVVFLSMDSPTMGQHVATMIQQIAPLTQIVGISSECELDTIRLTMQLGFCDFLVSPFTKKELEETLSRAHAAFVKSGAAERRSSNLFAFVSAKPGSGATTVALHAGLELARHTGLKTLLVDLDQGASVLEFLLKLPDGHGLRDAMAYGPQLDENIWKRIVNRVGQLDIVGLGTAVSQQGLTVEGLEIFLTYAQQTYDIVCLDLPSGFDALSLSIIERCGAIFLICTPELAPLYMANRRFELLKKLNLDDRVNLIVNRFQPRSTISDHVREFLEVPIFATIPNAYETLQKTIQEGKPLDRRTSVGRSFSDVAKRFTGEPEKKEEKSTLMSMIRSLLPSAKQQPELLPPVIKPVLTLPPGSRHEMTSEKAVIKYRNAG